jgi:hypothetical protein
MIVTVCGWIAIAAATDVAVPIPLVVVFMGMNMFH